MCWRRSWKPVLSVLNVISTAKAESSAYQYSIHLTKLSCVWFCSSCTFDYFTEYFMLSRNGSVCFTFRTYDKITYAYHTHVWLKNKTRIIRMNRTMPNIGIVLMVHQHLKPPLRQTLEAYRGLSPTLSSTPPPQKRPDTRLSHLK